MFDFMLSSGTEINSRRDSVRNGRICPERLESPRIEGGTGCREFCAVLVSGGARELRRGCGLQSIDRTIMQFNSIIAIILA
jgi:hypothetical protein